MPNYYPYQSVYQSVPTQQSQVSGGLNWVQGESAARAWLVAPGTSVLLMDSEASVFYIKTADASGMPLPLRVFDYTERRLGTPAKSPDAGVTYVTKEEFEEFRREILGTDAEVVKHGKSNV